MAAWFTPLLILFLAAPTAPEAVSNDGWKPYAVREEIAPRSFSERGGQGELVLGLAGRGDDAVDGRWVREVPVVPEKTYAFRASWRAQDVDSPARSVLARLVFLDAAGEPMRPMEYPMIGARGADGWTPVAGVYRAPEKAAKDVVASGYDFRSGIFDRNGKRIADAKGDPEVVVATVDLAEPTLWPWLGNWRARIDREAPAWTEER
jgi:hypothetical protein